MLEVVAHVRGSALAKGHEVGVIHRDLKPENMFVTMVSGKPYVEALDFGIAKLSTEASVRTAGFRSALSLRHEPSRAHALR